MSVSRRPRPAGRAAVAIAFAVALGSGAVAALGEVSGAATVGRTADRVGVQIPYPADVHVPPRRAFLISDSVLAGIRTTGSLDRLTGTTWLTDLEVCRRLVATSCRATGTPRPPTLVDELAMLRTEPDRYDLLVVATGYNDTATRFASDLATVVDAARAVGFRRVAWLTYRTDGTGSLFADYAAMNAVLDRQLATGDFPEVSVWDFDAFTTGRSEWFGADGLHLTAAGARAIADWLSLMASGTDVAP